MSSLRGPGHLAYLEQQASDPAPMAGWGLDAEGYIVQRPLTGESLVEYGAQIAQARAEALNSLEAQRRRIAYVEETISGAIADPEAQTPLGLVALSEAADIAVLSGAPVSEATWQQLYAYMVRDETAELVRGMLSTDAAPAGSANALARILEEKFVPPLLADDATFAAWASYKVAYFMTLTRAGVTSWAGGLPGLDTGRFFGLEYEMASGGNPDNVNRALANYGKLISEISFNLHNIGQHDLARRIIARFLP